MLFAGESVNESVTFDVTLTEAEGVIEPVTQPLTLWLIESEGEFEKVSIFVVGMADIVIEIEEVGETLTESVKLGL